MWTASGTVIPSASARAERIDDLGNDLGRVLAFDQRHQHLQRLNPTFLKHTWPILPNQLIARENMLDPVYYIPALHFWNIVPCFAASPKPVKHFGCGCVTAFAHFLRKWRHAAAHFVK